MASRVRAGITKAFLGALMIWCALFLLGEYTICRAPTGTLYVFTPRGWGIVADAACHALLITGFLLLYTLPALVARPWLGWVLRALMFGLFVVSLTYMQVIKVAAVVETPDHKTVFLAHYPIAPRIYDSPPVAIYTRSNIVAQLSFPSAGPDALVTYPVYGCDRRGNEDLDRFAAHLYTMKDMNRER